jgi:hypothetical protein
LKPKTVVVGVYFGNDMFDAYALTYRMETGADLRNPERFHAIKELDQNQPLWLQSVAADRSTDRTKNAGASRVKSLKAFVSDHLKLYALVRSYWYLANGGYDSGYSQWTVESRDDYWLRLKQLAVSSPDQMIAFESDGFRTILTPHYRMTGMDMRDLRIAEGVEVTHRALRAMQRHCLDNGARLLVVILPTKELAFAPFLKLSELDFTAARLTPDVNSLENELRRRILAFLDADKIDYVDALPALQRTISEKQGNPFFESRNGHFSRLGHRAIAQAVASHQLIQDSNHAQP